mgnify:FL=1|tara:strand:+ start:1827 stop:2123 length:297 start_codon:yes stop_codon:yes gene_type:complete
MGQLISFPKQYNNRPVIGLRINIYNEEQIEIILLAVNHFGGWDKKIVKEDIKNLDPQFTINSLKLLKNSFSTWIFSKEAIAIADDLLESVEEITVKST